MFCLCRQTSTDARHLTKNGGITVMEKWLTVKDTEHKFVGRIYTKILRRNKQKTNIIPRWKI